jgi:pyruvate, water dikinase
VTFVENLDSIDGRHRMLAGGKAASLGELRRAGITTPPGFVLLSTAFDAFLDGENIAQAIDSHLARVDPDAIDSVEAAAKQIQSLILNAKFPSNMADEAQASFQSLNAPHVAVRSSATAEDSATAAWAGQLDSFLNTTEQSVIPNIQRCWASLFAPRAIAYRFAMGLQHHRVSVAVVVQAMVQSEVAGVAFSVHPLAPHTNQIVIEAGFGLGEAVVSGAITPDRYVVDKKERIILDAVSCHQKMMLVRNGSQGNQWVQVPKERQGKRKLSGKQIMALSEIVIDIETHYGFPCDIEWVMAESAFSITQSRPITAKSAHHEPP